MALAHQHRHGRSEDHDADSYGGGDASGVEVVSAGSVTSFVRKLFQMVQGECDSIVGFVADGTAFEVKDPRRLEQDILPKYFRHSRFQSLVRQLNFYSFKKISKERSVWIYKHAFFRRDEPELLHALKRKTNQHGAPGRLGGGAGLGVGDDDMMAVDRPSVVASSLSRDANDNKTRFRGPSFPPRHSAGTAPFPTHLHHPHHPPPSPSSLSGPHSHHHNGGRSHPRPPHQYPLAAPRNSDSSGTGSGRVYHASSSRSTGGGPSTGGAAVPSYGGQGPSSRGGGGGASGYAWAGAGGRPVSSSGGQGGPGAPYERSVDGGSTGGGGGGGGMQATASSRGHGSRLSPPSQGYRRGPAVGDAGGERAALGRPGGNQGPAAGGGGAASDKEQSLALFGLSALCQVASATEARADEEEAAVLHAARARGGGGGGPSSGSGGGSRRLLDDGGGRGQQKRHRGMDSSATSMAAVRGRRGWAAHEESSGGEEEGEEDDEEEDGVTSAERDDSSASLRRRSRRSRRSRSNSSCVSSSSGSSSSGRSSSSSGRSSSSARSTHSDRRGRDTLAAPHKSGGLVGSRQRQHSPPHQYRRTSGSGGVFCPTWDWGRAACEPTIRLPGSFVDRRFEEVDEQVRNAAETDEEEVEAEDESGRTEGEDTGDEDQEAERETQKAAARKESREAKAPASPATEKTRALRPRDVEADMEAEAEVGLEGIGALFTQLCYPSEDDGGGSRICDTNASGSVFLATVTNSGDGGLREMSVFCAGPAGRAPDAAPPSLLARQVSLFLQSEEAVAEDLKVYAEALDPAAVDVVAGLAKPADHHQQLSTDSAKLLRVFCRYAACRLGRALEVASCAAAAAAAADTGSCAGFRGERDEAAQRVLRQQSAVARRVSPRLDECRWKWWRAAVRFS